jgi:hypothetical protein
MTAWAWAAGTLVGALVLAAVGDLISDEIRGWLDLAPRAILHLAATQLDAAQRETIYQDEWLPELTYALRGAEARPITRLITGIKYAMGILIAARHVADRLNRIPQSEKISPLSMTSDWREARFILINRTSHAITLNGHHGTRLNPNEQALIFDMPVDIATQYVKKGIEIRMVRHVSGNRFLEVATPQQTER